MILRQNLPRALQRRLHIVLCFLLADTATMTSVPGLSEAYKASPSADESPQYFQEHGFFVEEDLEIGETVDQLYKEQRFKDPDGLDRFRQRLMDLPVSNL